jgi:hypothetical protein
MSIQLTIIRPKPITQQEFESLIQNDPELDFSSVKNRGMGKRHAYQLVLNQGKIDIVTDVEFEDLPLEKLIDAADKLNARLWEDFDGTFFRKDGDNYRDSEYWNECKKFLPPPDSRNELLQPSRTSWKHPVGCIVILILFLVSLPFSVHLFGAAGIFVVSLLWVFALMFWIFACSMKRDKVRKQRIKRAERTEAEIAYTRDLFGVRLSEIAGTDKVLLILPNRTRECKQQALLNIDRALQRNIVVEKCFTMSAMSIITPKSIAKIDTEIRKSRRCRTIVFYNAFDWTNLKQELGSLEIMKCPPENPPKIVIYQELYGCTGNGNAPVLPDLTDMQTSGKISIALCLWINQVSGKGAEWIPQNLKTHAYGLPDTARKEEK